MLSRRDVGHANTGKGVHLVMNLAADTANRRALREGKAVEVSALVCSKLRCRVAVSLALGGVGEGVPLGGGAGSAVSYRSVCRCLG